MTKLGKLSSGQIAEFMEHASFICLASFPTTS